MRFECTVRNSAGQTVVRIFEAPDDAVLRQMAADTGVELMSYDIIDEPVSSVAAPSSQQPIRHRHPSLPGWVFRSYMSPRLLPWLYGVSVLVYEAWAIHGLVLMRQINAPASMYWLQIIAMALVPLILLVVCEALLALFTVAVCTRQQDQS